MKDRRLLIYGAGGAGKSSRCAEAAQWVWKTTGKRTRIVNVDGGGTTSAFQALIDLGRAEIWDADLWDASSIFQILDSASKGWWPSDLATPNSALLPPTRIWRACPFCGEDSGATGLAMVLACALCKKPFPPGTLLPVRRDPINGMENIGLVVFEGMTAFGELLLQHLRKIDPSGGNVIPDIGGLKISSAGLQHYGSAQSYIAQAVRASRTIPVDLVVWTALELRSDDDGKPLYGPAGPGKKLTAMCIPWFTDVIHLDAVAKKGKTGIEKDAAGQEILERLMYLAPHFPTDNPAYRFAAKTSAPHGGDMPTVLPPEMGRFFEELQKAIERVKERVK